MVAPASALYMVNVGQVCISIISVSSSIASLQHCPAMMAFVVVTLGIIDLSTPSTNLGESSE